MAQKPQAPASWRERIARIIAPALAATVRRPRGAQQRLYAAAKNTRTTAGFGSGGNSSADAELNASLPALRARSRQMVRDSGYAKRARRIIVNNVIGSGVGLQAQVKTTRGELNTRVNDDIETAWDAWAAADSCHTGGAMCFHDLERAAMGAVFEAGEVFIRLHRAQFGRSQVPLSLEFIEPERLAHEFVEPIGVAVGNEIRMGVEVDPRFQRAVAYWIRRRHPGDMRPSVASQSDGFERVPAADIMHLRVVDRWPQTRGEPWLHAALRKIDETNEYTGLEVSAARASAAYFATVESPEDSTVETSENADTGQRLLDMEPLTIQQLDPGEKLVFHTPNRPNSALDPFMRYMLREIAAGSDVSYESLSRDYSQSNYSSSRLALLDDRDLYKSLQQWWVRNFRRPLHAVWLQQAVLARAVASVPIEAYAIDVARYEAARFKPRGWSWIDPTKEVTAYKEAIRAGLTTLTDVIAATADGRDIEDVIETRKRELEMLEAADIEVDTTVPEPVEPAPAGGTAGPSPAAAAPEDDATDPAEDPAAAKALQSTIDDLRQRVAHQESAGRVDGIRAQEALTAAQLAHEGIGQIRQIAGDAVARIGAIEARAATTSQFVNAQLAVVGERVSDVEGRQTAFDRELDRFARSQAEAAQAKQSTESAPQ